MNKKTKSAERVSKHETAFKCPICDSTMKVEALKSLVCLKNHTFDFAKQGYVNLMTHPVNSHYHQELFKARNSIIMESNLYSILHEAIADVIRTHTDLSVHPFMVVDLGCGEGSHLQKILEHCSHPNITGVGLDISKEGIMMAAKNYDNQIWLVGDLAKSPLANHSFHVILNILSPSNYMEFKRILAEGGIVIKAVPRPNYLIELREALFHNNEKKAYKNDETTTLFSKHFQLLDTINLCYTKKLNQSELINLVQMTPLTWTAEKDRIGAFIDRPTGEITVDLDILIGKLS